MDGTAFMRKKSYLPGTILIAVDGYPTSLSTARLAIHLAQIQNWIVYGLFVIDSKFATEIQANHQPGVSGRKDLVTRSDQVFFLEKQGNRALNQLEADCDRAGVPVITELVFGNVSEMIQHRAQKSSLLTIGRHSQEHQQNPGYLGHNLHEILQSIQKPVLIGGSDESTIEKILFVSPDERYRKFAHPIVGMVESLVSNRPIFANNLDCLLPPIQGNELNPTQKSISDFSVEPLFATTAEEIVSEAVRHDVDLLILAGYTDQHSDQGLDVNLIEQVVRDVSLPIMVG